MKTAILVLSYAASSLAENPATVCIAFGAFPICDPLGAASETSTGNYKSEPTTGPISNANHFNFPDRSKIFDVNSSVDVHWVKDATDWSIQLNCTLDATKAPFNPKGNKPEATNLAQNISNIESLQFLLPNNSATCTLSMLDAHGNHHAESAQFNIRDAVDVKSSTTSGDLPTTLPTSDTAISLSSIFTNSAKSNATLTASSANSTSTAASSPLTSSVPSTIASPIMSSTVPTTTATKASNSGSNPIAKVQALVGILAGAAALVLFQWLS